MAKAHRARIPPLGLGVASLTLGTAGLLLFFLPILGLPFSVVGLLLGMTGLLASALGGRGLRLSVAGIGLAMLALSVNLAIARVPQIQMQNLSGLRPWNTVPSRPYVPPPAPPAWP